jgi:hypothetical protein
MTPSTSRGRVFYITTDNPHPCGGEKHTYEHVDILNDAGYEAYAVHQQVGARYKWFENRTRTMGLADLRGCLDAVRDCLVLPAAMAGQYVADLPGRKVIFNKGLQAAFRPLGTVRELDYAYTHPSVVAVFSVSDHNVRQLRFAFPRAHVYRVVSSIDPEVFTHVPLRQKKKQLAVATKAPDNVLTLFHILNARAKQGLNALGDCNWVVLEGYSEQQMAAILKETLAVVFLNTGEGLARVPREALACGCLLVGIGAGSMKECLPAYSQCDPEDFIGAAQRIEAILQDYPDRLERWTAAAEDGSRHMLAFSRERQRETVIAAWEDIMRRGGEGGSVTRVECEA